MAIHRTPNESEKEEIKKRCSEKGSIRCYVNNHVIPDESQIEYHHIHPFSSTGVTERESFAIVCKDHHRRIGLLSIEEFRARLDIEQYFQQKNIVKLDDILGTKTDNNYGNLLNYEKLDNEVQIYFANKTDSISYPLYMSCYKI